MHGKLTSAHALVVMLVILVGGGCQEAPSVADNSKMFVQPGRGITNLCEIGMDLSALKKATRDAEDFKDEPRSWRQVNPWRKIGRFVVFRSLGAVTYLSPDQKMANVTFHVVPHDNGKLLPDLSIHEPFHGSVGRLSFNSGAVNRTQVESVFGAIREGTTNSSDYSVFQNKNIPYWIMRGERLELHYPQLGVTFQFTSNVVSAFQIYKAAGTNG